MTTIQQAKSAKKPRKKATVGEMMQFIKPTDPPFFEYYGFHCKGPKKKVSYWKLVSKILYPTVMFLYSIYGVISAKQVLAEFVDLSRGYNNIITNWEQDVITDLTVIDGGAACPTGFNPFLFEWPGTSDGCDCRTIAKGDLEHQYLEKILYNKACNSTMRGLECLPVAATPSKNLTKIPNSGGEGQQICVQRATNSSFLLTADYLKADKTCSKGKLCGGSSVKDGLFLYCFNGVTCPLTNMVVSSGYSNSSVAYTKVADLKIEGATEEIWITREGNNLPLAELAISVSHVCEHYHSVPYFGKKDYPLFKESKMLNYSCQGGADSTFIKYLEFGMKAYLDENSVTYNFNTLGTVINASTKKLGLFGRPFIPFKQSCRNRLKKMKENNEKVKELRDNQNTLHQLAYYIFILIGISFPLSKVLMRFMMDFKCCRKIECLLLILGFTVSFMTLATVLMKIANAGILGTAVSISYKEKSFFNEVGRQMCSDNYFNSLLTKFASRIQNLVYKKNLLALISLCLMGTFSCCYCCVEAECERQKKEDPKGYEKDQKYLEEGKEKVMAKLEGCWTSIKSKLCCCIKNSVGVVRPIQREYNS